MAERSALGMSVVAFVKKILEEIIVKYININENLKTS